MSLDRNVLLQVDDLQACYGSAQALFGASLTIHDGEFVTLLGRNGMGKTTTVKSVMGMMPGQKGRILGGRITFAGQVVTGLPSYAMARLGIGLVPEQRQVFPNLSVRENLIATAHNKLGRKDAWTLARVYQLFPRLKEREKNLAANLSGGEQQMLAVGRALMTNPRLVILDEATEGLAPIIRQEIWQCLAELKNSGLSVLVIDKNIGPLLKLADTHVILDRGQSAWRGSSASLSADKELMARMLGV